MAYKKVVVFAAPVFSYFFLGSEHNLKLATQSALANMRLYCKLLDSYQDLPLTTAVVVAKKIRLGTVFIETN